MQYNTIIAIYPPLKSENLIPTYIKIIASWVINKRAVLKPNNTFSSNFYPMKVQVSLRNARYILAKASKIVKTYTIEIIAAVLSLKLLVPRKSLILYIFLNINLQSCPFVFCPITEKSIRYWKDPRIRLILDGNAV